MCNESTPGCYYKTLSHGRRLKGKKKKNHVMLSLFEENMLTDDFQIFATYTEKHSAFT